MDWLRQHQCSRYAIVDAFNCSVVSVTRDENDRCIAYVSKLLSDLDTFSTSFETNVHEDNVWLISHCKPEGLVSICRQTANIEAERVQGCFHSGGGGDFIVNYEGAAASAREGGVLRHFDPLSRQCPSSRTYAQTTSLVPTQAAAKTQ
jgi:hypothetical protein